jgi:prepilin-type processing-associated H-X9-DG protein
MNSNSLRCRVKSEAFTLVELLVVIAVLMVLVALLMPALSAARQKALAVQCMVSEKNAGTLILAYTNDPHPWCPEGYVFPNRYGGTYPIWADCLVSEKYVPDYNVFHCPIRASQGHPEIYLSYGFSDWLEWSGSGYCPKHIFAINGANPAPMLGRVPVIAECDNYRFLRPSWDGWQVWFYPVARHNGKCNVFFLDGHIQALTLKEFDTGDYYYGQIFQGCK